MIGAGTAAVAVVMAAEEAGGREVLDKAEVVRGRKALEHLGVRISGVGQEVAVIAGQEAARTDVAGRNIQRRLGWSRCLT